MATPMATFPGNPQETPRDHPVRGPVLTANRWDDDRPGMMRVHIAQIRGRALADYYSRDSLRLMASRLGVPTGHRLKSDLAVALAMHGAVPPGYDKSTES
jgi:hypothetical protein